MIWHFFNCGGIRMVKKYLPTIRALDHEISAMPKSPLRREVQIAICTILDFFLIIQESENLRPKKGREN